MLNVQIVIVINITIEKRKLSGSKGGDNGSNVQFLRVSDFGYWLKGNVHEFSRF